MRIDIQLPWPPSVNHYLRYFKGSVRLNKDTRDYKREVRQLSYTWRPRSIAGRLSVDIRAYPPDRRKRDLDNLLKVTLDSLEGVGLFYDDSHIDCLKITRCSIKSGGMLDIKITNGD